jgi:hypothetical protein
MLGLPDLRRRRKLWLAMTDKTTLPLLLVATALAACTMPQTRPPSGGHIGAENVPPTAKPSIPQPVQQSVVPPKPKQVARTETYSVVV